MRKITANELREHRERQLNEMRAVYNEFDPATEDMDEPTSVQMSANELLSIIEVFEEYLNATGGDKPEQE